MAGAGYKTFADGDVLTAAQVQTYLQDQAVMRFADSSARTTGLGTAVAEGMVSYLQDTDTVEVYDGSAWTQVGSDPNPGIGTNAVQTTKTDTFSTTSTSFTPITGLTATITPSTSASKILVVAIMTSGASSTPAFFRLSGGNTSGYIGDSDGGNRVESTTAHRVDGSPQTSVSIVYLDSPATTSAVTYGVEMRRGGVTGGTVYINRGGTDDNNADIPRTASSLTVIEVAA